MRKRHSVANEHIRNISAYRRNGSVERVSEGIFPNSLENKSKREVLLLYPYNKDTVSAHGFGFLSGLHLRADNTCQRALSPNQVKQVKSMAVDRDLQHQYQHLTSLVQGERTVSSFPLHNRESWAGSEFHHQQTDGIDENFSSHTNFFFKKAALWFCPVGESLDNFLLLQIRRSVYIEDKISERRNGSCKIARISSPFFIQLVYLQEGIFHNLYMWMSTGSGNWKSTVCHEKQVDF